MKIKVFLVIAILVLASFYFAGCKSDDASSIKPALSIKSCNIPMIKVCNESTVMTQELCDVYPTGTFSSSGCAAGAVATCSKGTTAKDHFYAGSDLVTGKTECDNIGGTWTVH